MKKLRQRVYASDHTNAKAVRLATIRKAKEDKEMDRCTFKPVVDSNSEKIMKELKRLVDGLEVSVFLQLYKDAQRRQET